MTNIASIRNGFLDLLDDCLPSGAPVALVGYPSHNNIGDHAIWAGQRRWLEDRGHPLVYAADHLEYSARNLETVAACHPGLTVLLHGGGNFGDLWMEHEHLRRVVLQAHSSLPIVQLPQTIHYRDPENVRTMRQLLADVPSFKLLCRDAESVRFAREVLSTDAFLAPDAAFFLDPPSPRRPPDIDVLWLSRTDAERRSAPLVPRSGEMPVGVRVLQRDWPDVSVSGPLPGVSEEAFRRWMWRASRIHRSSLGPRLQHVLTRLHHASSERSVDAGFALLARGRVVVTDRLHAHILATVLAIPNVVVDTGYGKLSGVVQEFTHALPTTHIAQNSADAHRVSLGLLVGQAEA